MIEKTGIEIESTKIGDSWYVRALRNKQCLAAGCGQTPQQARNQCYLFLLYMREDFDLACSELLRLKDDDVCLEDTAISNIPDIPGMPLGKLFGQPPATVTVHPPSPFPSLEAAAGTHPGDIAGIRKIREMLGHEEEPVVQAPDRFLLKETRLRRRW